jgi:hypothetical protein
LYTRLFASLSRKESSLIRAFNFFKSTSHLANDGEQVDRKLAVTHARRRKKSDHVVPRWPRWRCGEVSVHPPFCFFSCLAIHSISLRNPQSPLPRLSLREQLSPTTCLLGLCAWVVGRVADCGSVIWFWCALSHLTALLPFLAFGVARIVSGSCFSLCVVVTLARGGCPIGMLAAGRPKHTCRPRTPHTLKQLK